MTVFGKEQKWCSVCNLAYHPLRNGGGCPRCARLGRVRVGGSLNPQRRPQRDPREIVTEILSTQGSAHMHEYDASLRCACGQELVTEAIVPNDDRGGVQVVGFKRNGG